jgi:pimeloyl-ACP methyl ester carboxylesterase
VTETARSKDGTRIAYEKSGSGPPLVLVQGALSDRTVAAPLRVLLDPHFTVFAYDRRGRGESDNPDLSRYAPEREDEDLAAVLAVAGGHPFVYGHSSGAILALRAATTGHSMLRLAVYEPPLSILRTRPSRSLDVITRLTSLVHVNDRDEALRVFLTEAVGLPAAALAPMTASPMWARMQELAHTTPYDATLAETSALLLPAFATVVLPTLVLSGDASFPWIIETARVVAKTIPNAELATLPGQDHIPAPEILAPELIRFFGNT